MSRRFGSQINGERRVLGSLPVPAHPIKPLVSNNHQPLDNLKKVLTIQEVEDKENQEFYQQVKSKFVFEEKKSNVTNSILNESHDEGIYSQESRFSNQTAEAILDQSYEAMKKNLNSFLIDSDEKDEAEDKNDSTVWVHDESFNSVNFESKTTEVIETEEEANSSELMELSDCSLAPESPFTFLDLYQDYSSDVLKYCLKIERSFMPNPFYMAEQPAINDRMRAILVGWLFDVVDEYNLHDETLFLTVSYIDRYLSRAAITQGDFQLLGISALFIAAKYEEIYPPELSEFAYTTDGSSSKAQILRMEQNILRVLDFEVSSPTSLYFLKKFSIDLSSSKEEYYFAKYLCTLTLLDVNFIRFYPSEIALSCILLSMRSYGRDTSSQFLQSTLYYEQSLGRKGHVLTLLEDRNDIFRRLTKLQQNIEIIRSKLFSTNILHRSISKLPENL